MGLVAWYRWVRLARLLRDWRARGRDPRYWARVWATAWKLREVRDMLQGYKSYLVAALMGAVTVLYSLGYIDEHTYQTLMALLGAGAVGTVAAKVNRLAKRP